MCYPKHYLRWNFLPTSILGEMFNWIDTSCSDIAASWSMRQGPIKINNKGKFRNKMAYILKLREAIQIKTRTKLCYCEEIEVKIMKVYWNVKKRIISNLLNSEELFSKQMYCLILQSARRPRRCRRWCCRFRKHKDSFLFFPVNMELYMLQK